MKTSIALDESAFHARVDAVFACIEAALDEGGIDESISESRQRITDRRQGSIVFNLLCRQSQFQLGGA